jgi:hypothetical protein
MYGSPRRKTSLCLSALVSSALLAFVAQPVRSAEPSLAIRGYDPVAYFTQGRPVKGDPSFEFVWDDSRFRFISAEDRDLFKANPAQYVPQFPGFCAMSLADGVQVEPNPENWLIRNGKLYLFGKSIGPAKFSADLDDNIARANENWRRLQHGAAVAAPDHPQ